MLLLAALLGLVIFAAAVAAPPLWEGAAAREDGGPIDAWTNGPVWTAVAAPAEERPCARGGQRPATPLGRGGGGAAEGRPGESPAGERVGEDAPAGGGEGGTGDDARTGGDAAADVRMPQDAPLIADFDPAVETIEIAYAGDAPPELRFVETAEATEVLVDGVVVARMAGVTGLDPSHVSLIAA